MADETKTIDDEQSEVEPKIATGKPADSPNGEGSVTTAEPAAKPAPKVKKSGRRAKTRTPKRAKAKEESKRGRSTRPYPAGTFEDSLAFANDVFTFGSGTKVRRLSLFDHLKRHPRVVRAVC